MNSIFNPDNKVMQMLATAADYMVLNVIYVLCCIPVLTIGAAQAGLYTALRVLNDPEDDSSYIKAFFRGFRNGFGRVTVVWSLFLLAIVLFSYTLITVWLYQENGMNAPLWMSVVALALSIVFQSVIPAFHAKFDCTGTQLVRNAFFFILRFPIKCLLVTVLVWLPVVIGLRFLDIFLQGSVILMCLYYSFAFMIINALLKKPFQILTDNFNASREIQAEETPAE